MIIVDFDLGIDGHTIQEYAKDFLDWYHSDKDRSEGHEDYELYYDEFATYLMEEDEADDEEICNAMFSITAYFGNCFSVWYDHRSQTSVDCPEYEEWLKSKKDKRKNT
tara:strand:+ start:170 stop:493 length:324 start_codon:yes stop_codon:yes gene_type:complete